MWIFEYFPEISRKICTQDACRKMRNRLSCTRFRHAAYLGIEVMRDAGIPQKCLDRISMEHCLWDSAPFFVRLDRRKSGRGAVCRDQRKSVGTSETVVLSGAGLHRLGVHLGGTPLEGLRPDTGRGSTAGHADHYCPLLHLYRHLRQALALGRYSHICAGCGSDGILDMETHAPRQRRFMAGDPAVCRRCRLLRDLQSVPADGGDIWEPLKERCHR